MESQTQQLNETKKFGRYNIIYEHIDDIMDLMVLQDHKNNEITKRLINAKQKYGSNIIVLFDYLYHIEDTSVGITYDNKGCRISIWNQDNNKRKIARKFLEEILS